LLRDELADRFANSHRGFHEGETLFEDVSCCAIERMIEIAGSAGSDVCFEIGPLFWRKYFAIEKCGGSFLVISAIHCRAMCGLSVTTGDNKYLSNDLLGLRVHMNASINAVATHS
jgi:hypothetical protein